MVIIMFYSDSSSVPSLIHSSGSMSGASGSLCLPGGRGKQAASDTKVTLSFVFISMSSLSLCGKMLHGCNIADVWASQCKTARLHWENIREGEDSLLISLAGVLASMIELFCNWFGSLEYVVRMDNAINSIKPPFYYLLLYSYIRLIKVKMQANINNYCCVMKLKSILKKSQLLFVGSNFYFIAFLVSQDEGVLLAWAILCLSFPHHPICCWNSKGIQVTTLLKEVLNQV